MDNLISSIQNKALQGLAHLAGGTITGAIKGAADKTGVDFAYLLQQAKAESSFDATAEAKTSSASGLFQFIESTWMDMVDRYGGKHGIDTSAPKEELLALRKDPEVASAMAAEFANDNKQVLDRNWGGEVGSTELYFAHFLGAGSAAAFLKARDQDGTTPAAVLFPKAAKANQNVFYDSATGKAKSLDEVYAFFDKKFQIDDTPAAAAATQVASAPQRSFSSPVFDSSKSPMIIDRPPTDGLSYQSLIMNQMDLILLTQQLDLPLFGKDSSNKLL